MKKKLKRCLFLFIITVIYFNVYGQVSCRNGYWSANTGTIRALVVFAEAVGDTFDTYSYDGWPRGQMPVDPDIYFDHVLNPPTIYGKVTKQFYQASFGDFTFIGDYYPYLVRINFANIPNNDDGEDQILDYLANIPVGDITTAHGYSFNSNAFDEWEVPPGFGTPKTNSADDYIDMIFGIWRVNSKFKTLDRSGNIYNSDRAWTVKQKDGFHDRSYFLSMHGDAWTTLRHEFSHSLLGGNPMHTAGRVAGNRVSISPPGGYSLLNYCEALGWLYNGYDRYRLGWKYPGKIYYISMRNNTNHVNYNGDMEYGQPFTGGSNEYILRDFVTTGDAIRIKLPYLQSEFPDVYDQWLWLENHQIIEGNMDLNMTSAKGLYAYIQIGKESFSDFSGLAGYLQPLHAFGNYDFDYDISTLKSGFDILEELSHYGKVDENPVKYGKLIVNSAKSNPFTGYNMIQNMAFDLENPNPGGTPVFNEIYGNELFLPSSVEVDGTLLPESDFHWSTYPAFGTRYDAYTQGQKIGIGSNPSAVPVYTYRTRYGDVRPYSSYALYDNRKIYLNGLSIEILEQRANGDIKLRLRWDDYDVDNNVRWCGNIVLNETINLKTGKTILLDQGLTPTKPVNPMDFNGDLIFADYTILTCKNGSSFKLEPSSTVRVMNSSALVLEPGSYMEINDGSLLDIQTYSTLLMKAGSTIRIKGSGELMINSNAYICTEAGSNIYLEDDASGFHIHPSHIIGINPNISGLSGNCSDICLTRLITNTDITYNRTYTYCKVEVSNVNITNNSNVIINHDDGVKIYDNFHIELGSTFKIE